MSSRKKNGLSIVLTVAIAVATSSLLNSAYSQAIYSKTADLPALRISYSQLQAVLDKSAKLTAAAIADARIDREQMDVRAGEARITIPGHKLLSPSVRLPRQADRFTYALNTVGRAPITTVELDFSNASRTMAVHGSSPEQVDAVFAAMREELIDHSSAIGGGALIAILRIGIPLGLLVVAVMLIGIWFDVRKRQILTMAIVALAGAVILVFAPLNTLLAGFLVVDGDPAFLIRYGPEISFVGLLIGVAAFPFSYWMATPGPARKQGELGAGVPLQKIIESPAAVADHREITATDPTLISEKVRNAPLLQQAEIASQYNGIKVDWTGTLLSARKKKDDQVRLLISCSGAKDHQPGAAFVVNPSSYPGIGLLQQGALLRVTGVIADFHDDIFNLDNAKLVEYGAEKDSSKG